MPQASFPSLSFGRSEEKQAVSGRCITNYLSIFQKMVRGKLEISGRETAKRDTKRRNKIIIGVVIALILIIVLVVLLVVFLTGRSGK